MTTTADRRAADHLRADAFLLEAMAQEFHCRANELENDHEAASQNRRFAAAFRHRSASARQDAEQVPHHTEVE